MKKLLLPAIVFFFFSAHARQPAFSNMLLTHLSGGSKPSQKRSAGTRWQWYGGFGMYWSNYSFYLELQPGILYKLSDRIHLGANASLIYSSDVNFGTRRRTYIYGWDLIGIYIPERHLEISMDWQRLFAHIYQGGNHLQNNYNALFAGAGYRTSHVVIGVKYDLLYYKGKNFYQSPWMPFIRIYF